MKKLFKYFAGFLLFCFGLFFGFVFIYFGTNLIYFIAGILIAVLSSILIVWVLPDNTARD